MLASPYKEFKEALQDFIPKDRIHTDPLRLLAYGTDASVYRLIPKIVVDVLDEAEVVQLVGLADRMRVPVTFRAAGTSLSGQAVSDSVLVRIGKGWRNWRVGEGAERITLQPGIIGSGANKILAEFGKKIGPDPASIDSCFIGGNLATNAGGNRAVKYGTTRHQVYEFEVVTPLGEIVRLGSRLNKNTTGYCLEQLVMDSEGTLGIITQATLKLKPLPAHVIDVLAVFADVESAIAIVGLMLRAGLTPTCVEFMDNAAVQSVERFLQEGLPHSDNGHYVIIQLEADNEADLENKTVTLDDLCTENGAIAVLVADSQKIWKARKAFTEATGVESAVQSFEDIVVPVDRIPEAVAVSNRIASKYGLTIRMVSHAGDGNIHLTSFRGELPEDEWDRRLNGFEHELYEIVYQLGGRLSGEHGIGYKRKDLMQKFTDPVELDMMRRIKLALDPNLVLNPGKIFDIE